jgi:UDP-N-acetylmuramoylalanine--D-glutamate ligase
MRSVVVEKPPSEFEPRLEGLRVLVVGLGRSGMAAARLAVERGAHVAVTDDKDAAALGSMAEEARGLGATLHLGGLEPRLAGETDLVVVSPGVPSSVPLVVEARRRELPVWGEIELASRFCRGRIVGITGSNGKSTVTAMTGKILRGSGIAGGTGGNLGTPLVDLLDEDRPDAVHAVELSSFQLETIDTFRPAGAVVVNLSPDHLDRYDGFDAYVAAKARLLEAQDERGFAVLNADDPESARLLASVRGRPYRFSTRDRVEAGAWLEDGTLTVRTETGEEPVMEADELPVPGEHNVSNALAAAIACRLVGCAPEAIANGLRSYRALPHRLEYVATTGGVEFYNDSKATNLDAAARALGSFTAGTIHLIVGGRDKGGEWDSLAPLVRERARRVLLVGEAATTIREILGDVAEMVDCGTIAEAVSTAFADARRGDVVLLSPGCASFDQYRNFEERGDDFQRAVRALASEDDPGA